MQKRKTLQKQHEKAVCDNLLGFLNIEASFLKYGDDKTEPDIIYRLGNKSLGIEVATAYYDNTDAKQEWTLAAGEREFTKGGFEFREGGVIKGPDELIYSKIQQEINDKCHKKYSDVMELWLCVEERASLSDKNSIRKCIDELRVPEGHQFNAIYVLHRRDLRGGGGYEAFKL